MSPGSLDFCPHCGLSGYQYHDGKYWFCPSCQFTYYHNVASSASVILEIDGSFLMLVRNRNPRKGMLGVPGGFVDPDERAEDAAIRECREETGLEADSLSFVGSWPNEYIYKDVTYKTCDLYFSARLTGTFESLNLDSREVAAFRLVSPEDIDSAPIAFESARKAILAYLENRKNPRSAGNSAF
jgi:NAD+ diphosphatase